MLQFAPLVLAVGMLSLHPVAEKGVVVTLDVSEAPGSKKWAEEARRLMIEWHPRIANLLPSRGFEPPRTITLKMSSTYKGVAATSGEAITVSSRWIEEHPEDVGVVIHELVHVIQAYPKNDAPWLTEGIADYVRWAIYEGKPQEWFPRPREKQGYKKGYRDAAGFLLWLERDRAPGIVNRLNRALRGGTYSDEIFQKAAGLPLAELWNLYVNDK
jgi:hypothetical protein